jgi:hypothetical protein
MSSRRRSRSRSTPKPTRRRWKLDDQVTVTVAGTLPSLDERGPARVSRVVIEMPTYTAGMLGHLIDATFQQLIALEPLFGESVGLLMMPTEHQLAEALLEAAACHPTYEELAMPVRPPDSHATRRPATVTRLPSTDTDCSRGPG